MDFTSVLHEIMRREGINKKELIKRSDISHTSIRKYINGESIPNVEFANKLVNSMGYKIVFRKINNESKTKESIYSEKISNSNPENADKLLCEFVKSLGYYDVAKQYESVTREKQSPL